MFLSMEANMQWFFFLRYKIKATFEKAVCICAVSQPCFPFIKTQDQFQGQPKLATLANTRMPYKMYTRLLSSHIEHFKLLLVIQKCSTHQWHALLLHQKAQQFCLLFHIHKCYNITSTNLNFYLFFKTQLTSF